MEVNEKILFYLEMIQSKRERESVCVFFFLFYLFIYLKSKEEENKFLFFKNTLKITIIKLFNVVILIFLKDLFGFL